MADPKISIVMPAYNAGEYIELAITSILKQTFTDFELIVVNDGSTDQTATILADISDKRLRVLNQENNGLVYSLNRAIAEAKAPIIARHDADDSSHPERLRLQFEFLQKHPKTVLVGSSMGVMDLQSNYLHEHFVLLNNPELKQELLVRSPFPHGAVMFRKAAAQDAGMYKQDEWPAEDYGLWVRMAPFGEFANLNAPLYVYRENTAGISATNSVKQQKQTEVIRQNAWRMRKLLLPLHIDTRSYSNLEMEEFRVERLTHNQLFILGRALSRGYLLTLLKIVKVILTNKRILRKCVRLIMIKTRLKHA